MNEKERVVGFFALLRDHITSGHFFEEPDGSHRLWKQMSPEGKLAYIASDAAMYDVPFRHFADAVREAIGNASDASLRLVLSSERELHGLAALLPDEGGTASVPLIDRFKEALSYRSDRTENVPELDRD